MAIEMAERAYALELAFSNAEMIAIIDLCGKKKCPFSRAGLCDPDRKMPCFYTTTKNFLSEVEQKELAEATK